ncbi:MAG: exosortase W [Deltaproteobacteria bacterium]
MTTTTTYDSNSGRRGQWTLAALITAAFFFSFAKVLGTLAWAWWDNTVYSHGFLVPLISAYLVYVRRDSLKGTGASPSYLSGLGIFLSGIAMLIAGNAAGVMVVQELSIVVTLAGAIVVVFGLNFLRILWLPVAYLLFMLRFWELITVHLHYPFQNFSASLGAKILSLVGIPAYRDGIFIELPNITLEVAEVCSGVNYLISVLAIGIPLAYLTLKSVPKRMLLVFGGLIIAGLANAVRVALIGVLVRNNVPATLHGPGHVLQAMFVAVIGFIALFVGAWALSAWERKGAKRDDKKDGAPTPPAAGTPWPRLLVLPSIIAASMLILTGAQVNFHPPSPRPLDRGLQTLPYAIGKWTGFDDTARPAELKDIGADMELSRTYLNGSDALNVYIAYFASQTQGKELVNYKTHSLEADANPITLNITAHDAVTVRQKATLEKTGLKTVLYWYDLSGRVVTQRHSAKAYTAYDAIFKGRTNGAIIVITADNADAAQAAVAAQGFAVALIPELRHILK